MKLFLFIKLHVRLLLLLFFILFSILATCLYLTVGQRGGDNVLVVLASEFLKWNVNLPTNGLPERDISNYYSNFYVYFGPLPSILLMPFAYIFGKSFPQVTIGISAMIMSFSAIYFISKKFKFDFIDSLWIALFFVFSTVLFSSSVINISAYQVEAFGVPFILFSILAYLTKKNPLLVGMFLGLALLTRFTLVFSIVFFFFEFMQKRFTLKKLILLLVPVFFAIVAFGIYNNHRFHSFFETGYSYNISKNNSPISGNLKYGDISLRHVPSNLYSFLIMPPLAVFERGSYGFNLAFPYLRADGWGVAIWFTSPLFLFLITKLKKGTYSLSAFAAAILLSMPVFLWYSIGFAQFGYRYALDFMPFLFLLLIPSLQPKLSKIAIALIILGITFNLFYADSIFGAYPLFGSFAIRN